jgi:aminoglycoside phosphotransferase (APT) family kinase protein
MPSAPDLSLLGVLTRKIDATATLLRAWPLEGGISAQVMAIELIPQDGTSRRLVVRKHGAADLADNPNVAADEFRLLHILRASGIPVPEPVLVDNSGEIFGSPCVVISFIDGTPDYTPADPIDLVHQFAAHLARIHTIDGISPEITFVRERTSVVTEALTHQPAEIDESLQEGRIRDTLAAAWPLTSRNQPALLHGDYWPGNILCRDGRVLAIIDWEDASRGDPLADVANCRMEIAWTYGFDAMQAFTSHYLALTSISGGDLPHWDLAAALRPAGKLSEWAWNDDAEQKMRVAHRGFVEQAFAALSR